MIVLQLVVWLDAVASRAPAPTRHGEGALRPWGRCPLIPRRFSSPHPRETITPSQLGKNISPTRKIEKHTPATLKTLQTLQTLQTSDLVRRGYGVGTEKV